MRKDIDIVIDKIYIENPRIPIEKCAKEISLKWGGEAGQINAFECDKLFYYTSSYDLLPPHNPCLMMYIVQ